MSNKKRIVIGIIGIPNHDAEDRPVICLYDGYREGIVDRGAIPLTISPLGKLDYYKTDFNNIPALTEEEKKSYQDIVDMCDGILMQGGYRMYNYCEYILRYAIEKDIPVLGICMGMQLLAKIDNNEYCLEENKTNINHKQINEKYVHTVEILDDTLLKRIIGEKKIRVNSKHRFHVTKTNNFLVSAYSEDGLIEGIELPNKKFVIGIQWHPEKMLEYDQYANRIFDEFIKKCQK